jgi:hypothetical protein
MRPSATSASSCRGGRAKKEHSEFSSNIDLIDTLPPGLYEAVFENRAEDTANPDLVVGNWVMRCEARSLDDIRALGGNDVADERRFATAARVSEINLALYRTFAQPLVRAIANAPLAGWMQQLHPLRLQYELFSSANPMMAPVAGLAEQVQGSKASPPTIRFLQCREHVRQIVTALDTWRDINEALAERMFLAAYGLPMLQAAVGIDPKGTQPLRKATKSALHEELLQRRIAELRSRISAGGLREVIIRALLYAGMTRAAIDERGFEVVRRIREVHSDLSLSDFKSLVREQFNMLLIDQEAALAAIPSMLPPDAKLRSEAFGLIEQVLHARGDLSAEDKKRLSEVAQLFAVGEDAKAGGNTPLRKKREDPGESTVIKRSLNESRE